MQKGEKDMAEKMMTCKACGGEMAASAKTCPKCGAKNKKPFYKRVWLWVLIVIAVVAVGSTGGSDSSTEVNSDNGTNSATTDTNKNVVEKKEKFEVVNGVEGITVEQDMFSTYFTGVVQNNTDKEYSYVQIEISLYDAEGALLGTALDNVNNLEANGKWKFKAMSFLTSEQNAEIASYKITDITGW